MARNEEKALHMLNRWYTQKKEIGKQEITRPKGHNRISQINSLQTCQKWRNTIIREISKLVAQIQNAGLGEFKIRELNDEINDLFKQKKHYEERIYELGGGNLQEAFEGDGVEGSELPGFAGYKYFGAAKDLPGVRELFQKEKPKAQKRQMLVDVYQKINFEEYLGKKVDNLEEIEANEIEVENTEREELFKQWVEKNKDLINQKLPVNKQNDREAIQQLIDEDGENEDEDIVNQIINEDKDQAKEDQSKHYILEEKKKQLMEQYLKDIK